MKKTSLLLVAAVFCASASAQTFGKGDMVFDLGIGVGSADNVEVKGNFPNYYGFKKSSGATFTQKIAFEYGVAEFGKASIGFGMIVGNAYGASYEAAAAGVYDYTYELSRYHYARNKGGRYVWSCYQSTSERRKGVGMAKASYAVENIDLLVKGSFHYQFIDNLDTYGTFGLGASVYKILCSPDKSVTQGFSTDSNSFDSTEPGNYQLVYSYDDLSHAEWSSSEAKARFAMALFVGARYYLTPNWAINAEFGLTSASFKENANTYNVLSVGASYKF